VRSPSKYVEEDGVDRLGMAQRKVSRDLIERAAGDGKAEQEQPRAAQQRALAA
jgi:hypothetical protein